MIGSPDGKRLAALIPVKTPEAQPAQNDLIFLQFFEGCSGRYG